MCRQDRTLIALFLTLAIALGTMPIALVAPPSGGTAVFTTDICHPTQPPNVTFRITPAPMTACSRFIPVIASARHQWPLAETRSPRPADRPATPPPESLV